MAGVSRGDTGGPAALVVRLPRAPHRRHKGNYTRREGLTQRTPLFGQGRKLEKRRFKGIAEEKEAVKATDRLVRREGGNV